jgi:hypothetical protein
MKLDNATMQVLKNFAAINKNIMFKPGNVIRTISSTKSVLARAKIDQELEKGFAVYDLSRFIGTLSLFNEPELEVKDSHVLISEGSNKFNYAVTDPSLIIVPPDREIELPDPEVNCLITEEALNRVMKALSVSQLPEIAIVGKDGQILLQAVDTRGTTNDSFSVVVGQTDARFRMVFRSDCIKLMPGSYDVSISSKGLSHWKGTVVEYWIAVESNSSFEG